MPTLIVSGILLARRRPFGFPFGAAVAVMGAAYQISLMIAGVYQDNADAAGVKAFPSEGVALKAAFVTAALLMLLGGRASRRNELQHQTGQ